jgi:hypothetical protein
VSRVVLLGASNVTLGFGVLTRLVRSGLQGPLEIRAALGHGRSYGVWSSVLARGLPSISGCGLWEDLEAVPPAPTFALLTDVGNDLMYEFPPERIAGWVETCLARLAAAEARIVVTRLPVARVQRLSAWRYHATRASFFPRHRPIPWSDMLARVRDLDERVTAAAESHGAAVVTPPLEWYGVDPIHIRWSRRTSAWSDILSHWPGFERRGPRCSSLPLLGRLPQECRLFGRERRTEQPVFRRADVSLSLY